MNKLDDGESKNDQNTNEHSEKKVKIGKIEVNRDACIGAASCVALAPETFELDQEAKAVIINSKGNSEEDILEAAKSCPTDAIIVWNKEGKKIWPLGKT